MTHTADLPSWAALLTALLVLIGIVVIHPNAVTENGGNAGLGSYDLYVASNLDGRVELLTQVEDPPLRDWLMTILDTYFKDTIKPRRLLPDGSDRRTLGLRHDPVSAKGAQ